MLHFIHFRMRAESVTSAKSRTSTRDRYRVKSKTSDVDETLFASPTKRKTHAPPKKETVQVSFYWKSHIRMIHIFTSYQVHHSDVWPPIHFSYRSVFTDGFYR